VAKLVSGKDEQGDFKMYYIWKSLILKDLCCLMFQIFLVNESDIAQILPQTLPMKTKHYSFSI
jgi:hypothetical protein